MTFTVGVSNPSNVPLTGIRLEFGDGSAGAQFGASGGTVTKIYNNSTASVVTYTATATATDQSGNRYSQSTPVAVRPRAALAVTLDAAVNENTNTFSCSTTFPKVCSTTCSAFVPPPGTHSGVRVLFTARPRGVLVSASRYIWDFNGDGVADRETSSATTDFLFTIPGEYIVRVRVATTDGNFGEQYLTLRISP